MAAGAEQEVQRLDAVADNHHLVHDVVFPERPQRESLVVRIVLDQKDRPLRHLDLRSRA
jgi:hypothetical protein